MGVSMDGLELHDFYDDLDEVYEESTEVSDESYLEDYEEVIEEDTSVNDSNQISNSDDLEVQTVQEPVSTTKEASNVERYTNMDIVYPCLVLPENVELPKHTVDALSRMIESSLVGESNIKIYFPTPEGLLSLGGIKNNQVKAIIDLLGRENLIAYYSKGYELVGDMVYVLSS